MLYSRNQYNIVKQLSSNLKNEIIIKRNFKVVMGRWGIGNWDDDQKEQEGEFSLCTFTLVHIYVSMHMYIYIYSCMSYSTAR